MLILLHIFKETILASWVELKYFFLYEGYQGPSQEEFFYRMLQNTLWTTKKRFLNTFPRMHCWQPRFSGNVCLHVYNDQLLIINLNVSICRAIWLKTVASKSVWTPRTSMSTCRCCQRTLANQICSQNPLSFHCVWQSKNSSRSKNVTRKPPRGSGLILRAR